MTDVFAQIAHKLKLTVPQVTATAELLDSGNTIPFIARFRKDQTGGLDPTLLLAIRKLLASQRGLDERKTFVIKSIESQGGLTPELEKTIQAARSSRDVEDLYLPFKTRKQSLALTARQQGLEPLAQSILAGGLTTEEAAAEAKNLVRVDRGLNSVDDVMVGVRYLLAEQFADYTELRNELRQLVWKTGKLVCRLVLKEEAPPANPETVEGPPSASTPSMAPTAVPAAEGASANPEPVSAPETVAATSRMAMHGDANTESGDETNGESSESAALAAEAQPVAENSFRPLVAVEPGIPAQGNPALGNLESGSAGDGEATSTVADPQDPGIASVEPAEQALTPAENGDAPAEHASSEQAGSDTARNESESAAIAQAQPAASGSARAALPGAEAPGKRKRKKKKKRAVENPFAELENFEHPLARLPHHRVLAINRGEKAGMVRVKVKADSTAIETCALQKLVPAGHGFADLMSDCVRDALSRMILPALEREVRRELTENAEAHAVRVFAHNLSALLMQTPVADKRILAIDPGFKSGCSIAIVDPRGTLIAADRIFVVGNQARREECQLRLAALVRQHQIDVIAIGNGAGAREAEQIVSDAITRDLADLKVQYVLVNEAGASVYSTSEIGKEELPEASPGTRSAVSIARRLIDPLSELVKISPSHLGIGLYQHDIRARHLADSLDEVVMQCVNLVGVNVNTASPALLRYVSGLNQLTARRVFDFRQQKPFTNREMLREVAGVGDATFVQAAGFLRVYGGDSPLDQTRIHPESYGIATTILERIGSTPAEWMVRETHVKIPVLSDTPNALPAVEPSAAPGSAGPSPDSQHAELTAAELTAADSVVEQPTADESNPQPAAESQPPAIQPPAIQPPAIQASARGPENVVALSAEASSRQADAARVRRLGALNQQQLAAELGIGELLMRDLVESLARPTRDPRSGQHLPVFRSGILAFEQLKPEMQLQAQVVNVVDFGVFVDVGLGHTCLVHISELSRGYIQDLHEEFAVGDVLDTWVQEIDAERRRVKLSALPPGTKRFERQPRGGGRRDRRGPGGNGEGTGPGSDQTRNDREFRRGPRDEAGSPAGAGVGSESGSTSDRGRGDGRNFRDQRGPRDNQGGQRDAARSSGGQRNGGNFGGGRGDDRRGGDRRNDRSGPRDRHERGDRRDSRPFERKPSKPKFVKPIEQDMLSGDKPMRSFSDLAQFFTKKEDPKE